MISEQDLNEDVSNADSLRPKIDLENTPDVGLEYYLDQLGRLDVYSHDDRRKGYENQASETLIKNDEKKFIVLFDVDEDDFRKRFMFRPSQSPLVDISYSEENKQTILVFRTEGSKGARYPWVPLDQLPENDDGTPRYNVAGVGEKWSDDKFSDKYRQTVEKHRRLLTGEANIIKALGWLTKVNSETNDKELSPQLIANMFALLGGAVKASPDVEWRVRIQDDLDHEDDSRLAGLRWSQPYKLINRGEVVNEFALLGVNEPNPFSNQTTLSARNITSGERVMNVLVDAIPKNVTVYSVEQEMKNIGPKSLEWLHAIGVDNIEDVKTRGIAQIYAELKAEDVHVSRNLMWALWGAVNETHWTNIPPEEKSRLQNEVKELYN